MTHEAAEIAKLAEREAIVTFIRRTAAIAGYMGKTVAAETARILATQIEEEKHNPTRARAIQSEKGEQK